MTKKIVSIALLSLAVIASAMANPVKKILQTGGFDREYLIYTPSNAHAGKPDGIIVCLHGLNGSMQVFFEEYQFRDIADSLNYILLSPQALPEQEQSVRDAAALFKLLGGNDIPLDAVWGCGLGIKARSTILGISLLDEELNKSLDDTGFIDLMIARTLSEYNLEARNIFMLGTSLGGYMAYQLALVHGTKFAGLISIAGSMGLNIKGMEGNGIKIPVCDFHSTTDEVVRYSGSFEQSGMRISLAQDKQEVINYWVRNNSAMSTPVVEEVRYYPSSNGITVEKFTYPDPENEVVHYRMNGSQHSYFFRKEAGDCMDYAEEVMKFIASHAEPSADTGNTGDMRSHSLTFYPNPASDRIYFDAPDGGGHISIYSLATGKQVVSQTFQPGPFDISSLKPGVYIIRTQTKESTRIDKLIKH
ncbi:MAG: T9SS type A sorting domain-containing protein [Dysgonamonadaceae bacterium]|jgi:poly(3-hydroxybutyrate) depolymerase|nr:T9SS type A sorting domain-containing protein [Dysgonamonadaceae bacterium]